MSRPSHRALRLYDNDVNFHATVDLVADLITGRDYDLSVLADLSELVTERVRSQDVLKVIQHHSKCLGGCSVAGDIRDLLNKVTP